MGSRSCWWKKRNDNGKKKAPSTMNAQKRMAGVGLALLALAVFNALGLEENQHAPVEKIFLGVFLPFWLGLLILISFFSGWIFLAEQYRYSGQEITQKKYFQGAAMRWWMGYNGCLTVGANREGVYMSVWLLFRSGHPPLFIPWEDVSVQSIRSRCCEFFEFRTTKVPFIPIRVSKQLGAFLSSVSGDRRLSTVNPKEPLM